jgi:hypothetical protein
MKIPVALWRPPLIKEYKWHINITLIQTDARDAVCVLPYAPEKYSKYPEK